MRALLPLALLLATGCYSPRAIPSEASQPDPYGGWYEAPLEATLWFHEHDGYASFQVNRPASVAIFAMRPGGGMEMIYPRAGFGGNLQFSGGTHMVRTAAAAGPLRLASNWSMAHGASPMYILMVASEEPLDVNAFRFHGGSWFARSSLTHSPYYALEALVDEVVPNPSRGGWTTAMQVVWPSGVWPDYEREAYRTVYCPNGMIVTVPARVLYSGLPICPGDEQQPTEEADSTGEKDGEGEPVGPQLPPGWMDTDLDDRRMKDELRRIRNLRSADVLTRQAGVFPQARGETGGAALGVASRRPVADWPPSLQRPATTRAGLWPGIDSPPARQPATRSRPASVSRPSSQPPAVRRPAANSPRPASRPAAQPRSRPDPTPVRPPTRTRPEPRPTPSKPKPDDN